MWTDWIRWINIATNECLCWRECKNFNWWSLLKIERGREKKDQTIDTCWFEVILIMLDTRSVTVACTIKREREQNIDLVQFSLSSFVHCMRIIACHPTVLNHRPLYLSEQGKEEGKTRTNRSSDWDIFKNSPVNEEKCLSCFLFTYQPRRSSFLFFCVCVNNRTSALLSFFSLKI